MSFAHPLWFWAFALFPILIAVFFQNEGRRRVLLRKLVAARLLDRLVGTVSVPKRRWRFALILLGLACLVTSLAQPRYGFTWQEAKRRGRDVIIAIDTSKSMLATDLSPNRLTRAKLAAEDLIQQLQGDRAGVIAFAGTSFLQAPLTADYGAVRSSLQELDTDIIPRGGSDIAGAIRTAMEAFGKGESDHRALIIFTDGEELDADGVREAEKQKDVLRIFTVGLGSPEGSLIPVPGARGGTEFVKDSDGQIVKSRLDEGRLRKIAEAGGGFYLRLQNSREQMSQLIRDGLGKMTESDIDAKTSRQPIERYQWPLAAGLLLLSLSLLIGERRRTAAPTRPMAQRPTAVALLLAMLVCPVLAWGKNSGVEAYERQDYKTAEETFSQQLKRRPGLAELEFNLGSAAYQTGDFEKALEAFSKAVTSPNPKLQEKAEYNLGNTLFRRGAELKDKEPKIQEWKNALQHYDQALKVDPKDPDARYNHDLVSKLIEELEKPPPEEQQQKEDQKDKKDKQDKKDQQDKQDKQDKQDQENQQEKKDDQKDQKQNQQDQQKQQDQKSSDSEKQEGKDGEQKDSKEQSGKDQQKDSQQKDSQQKKDNQQNGKPENKEGKDGQQPQPTPEQPGKKKEGELKEAPQFDKSQQEQREAAEQAEAEAAAAEGRMTEQQAKSFLESLKSEDARVHLLDPREQKRPGRVLRDW
jgi:Ca-activated chloride channel family protein